MKHKLPFAVTLLLLIAFCISGLFYVLFDVAQLGLKMDARQDIAERSNLQTVKLSLEEFNKNKDKDEAWINGKLYDISSYVIINDEVLVTALHDDWEEGLVKSIVDSFEPNDRYANDNVVHLCKYRIHMPDDGKVLTAKYTVEASFPVDIYMVSPKATVYASLQFTSVIKPPPRYFLS